MEYQAHSKNPAVDASRAQDVSAEPAAPVSTAALSRVALCIPTYRRNDQLDACLDAVACLRLPPAVTLHVLVCDNDGGGGARPVCAVPRGALETRYCIEPGRGLCCVRNRLLVEALATGADFIAFLDDDELPHPDWLAAHLAALAGGADVSTGPVIQSAPAAGADYDAVPSGNITPRFVACNNVVFRRRLAAEQQLRFDMHFNFTGGEDFDYFEASRRLGNRHMWTADARVYEPLTPERATWRYQFHRHCSGAVTRVLQERKWRPGAGVWPRYLLKSVGKFVGAGTSVLRALLPGQERALHEAVKRCASGCGYLCGLLHVRIERYR